VARACRSHTPPGAGSPARAAADHRRVRGALHDLARRRDAAPRGAASAGLVTGRKRGRERWHYLDAVPLRRVRERWADPLASNLAAGATSPQNAGRDPIEWPSRGCGARSRDGRDAGRGLLRADRGPGRAVGTSIPDPGCDRPESGAAIGSGSPPIRLLSIRSNRSSEITDVEHVYEDRRGEIIDRSASELV
jgi:hypothetical protein